MIAVLLALLRNDLSGGGGAGPFVITGVNLTQQQPGSSCESPLRVNASLSYTGSPSGKTVTVEQHFGGVSDNYQVVLTGVSPTTFPRVLDAAGYYDKFGVSQQMRVRVTDESDATNTRTSATFTKTYVLCGA